MDSSSQYTVDVVDDLLFLGPALEKIGQAHNLTVERSEPNWIPFVSDFESAADTVVIRAELADHVPTVLKVRGIRNIGATPIVVCDSPTHAHTQRLYQAGARAVLTKSHSLHDLVQAIKGWGGGLRKSNEISDVMLSDRELQAACLYAGSAAPSARVLSEILNLPLTSVRTYIHRARVALRQVAPTSSRRDLRQALIIDGWLNDAPR